jgi:hypothetical protein
MLSKSLFVYFQKLHVEHTQSLLHCNDVDIGEIATEISYANGTTLK